MKKRRPGLDFGKRVYKLPDLDILGSQLTPIQVDSLLTVWKHVTESKRMIQQLRHYREDCIKEPIFHHAAKSFNALDRSFKEAISVYCDQHIEMRWMILVGVGVKQAAALPYLIDIKKAPYPSSIFRYAGLDPSRSRITYREADRVVAYYKDKYKVEVPTREIIEEIAQATNRNLDKMLKIAKVEEEDITWRRVLKGLRSLTYNRELREALYVVQLTLVRRGDKFPYYRIYKWRKDYETKKNEAGYYAEQAEWELQRRNYRFEGKLYNTYKSGKLPPMHIEARCRRFMVKIFIVHLHQVMYYKLYKKMPPKPYILDVLGKDHEIVCPKWPFTDEK